MRPQRRLTCVRVCARMPRGGCWPIDGPRTSVLVLQRRRTRGRRGEKPTQLKTGSKYFWVMWVALFSLPHNTHIHKHTDSLCTPPPTSLCPHLCLAPSIHYAEQHQKGFSSLSRFSIIRAINESRFASFFFFFFSASFCRGEVGRRSQLPADGLETTPGIN